MTDNIAGAAMRLPVFRTIQNGVVMAARIGRRHLGILAGFAVFFAVIQFDPDPANVDGPSRMVSVIQSALGIIASLIIAILTHREILVGPTSFRSVISRPAIGRLGWFFVDSLAVGSVLIGPVLLAVIIILIARPSWLAEQYLFFSSLAALFLVSGLFAARLALKLPACAVDEPLTWRQVWTLGQGNTLRLLVMIFLASGILSWLSGWITGAIAHVSPILAHLVSGVFSVGLTVLATTWLAVSYLYLTVGSPAAPAETDA